MSKAQVIMNENELRLYGPISSNSWYDDDVITSKQVEDAIKDFEGEEINVRINSPGGDVFESIAISNTLKNLNAKVNIVVDGLAASGGSIIAMAGDTVRMYANSTMMIHNAWTVAMGNAKELRKYAEDLDVIDSSVRKTYASRFNGSEEDLISLLDNETYLTAEQCLAYGLIDEIITDDKPEEPKNQVNDIVNKRVNEENTLFNNLKKMAINYIEK